MIPISWGKGKTDTQAGERFCGVQYQKTLFPNLKTAKDLEIDAFPALAPRRKRQVLRALPSQIKGMYSCGGRLWLLLVTTGGAELRSIGETPEKHIPLGGIFSNLADTPLAAAWEEELIFPALRTAVNVRRGTWRTFDDSAQTTTWNYITSTGIPTMKMTFEDSVERFQVGDQVILYANQRGESWSNAVYVSSVDSESRILELQGSNLRANLLFSAGTCRISRYVPEVRTAAGCGRRLWAADGAGKLYASAQDDLLAFYPDEEESSRRKAAVFSPDGCGGEISALSSLRGTPVLFTARDVMRVSGSGADEFNTSPCRGIGLSPEEKRTVAELGGALYFYGEGGIYRYNGTDTMLLAPCSVKNGLACVFHGNYYLWDGETTLWRYDPATDSMVGQVLSDVRELCSTDTGVFALCRHAGGTDILICLAGQFPAGITQAEEEQEKVESGGVFGQLQTGHRKAEILKLCVSGQVEENGALEFFGSYDGGAPIRLGVLRGEQTLRKAEIPLLPRVCGNFSLSFSGGGGYRITSIYLKTREI